MSVSNSQTFFPFRTGCYVWIPGFEKFVRMPWDTGYIRSVRVQYIVDI